MHRSQQRCFHFLARGWTLIHIKIRKTTFQSNWVHWKITQDCENNGHLLHVVHQYAIVSSSVNIKYLSQWDLQGLNGTNVVSFSCNCEMLFPYTSVLLSNISDGHVRHWQMEFLMINDLWKLTELNVKSFLPFLNWSVAVGKALVKRKMSEHFSLLSSHLEWNMYGN